MRVKYLQGEFASVEAVLRTVRGGVAQAPVESDASHLKLGPEPPSTHIKLSSHIDGHWRQTTHITEQNAKYLFTLTLHVHLPRGQGSLASLLNPCWLQKAFLY